MNWSVWLVSKESPYLSGSKPSYTKSATYFTATPAVISLQRAHKKNTRLQKPSVSNIVGRRDVQECLHMVKWVVQRVTSEPPRAPGC